MNKKFLYLLFLMLNNLYSQTFKEFDNNFRILLDTLKSPVITINELMFFNGEINKNLLRKIGLNILTDDPTMEYKAICKYNILNSKYRLYFLERCCIENSADILILIFDLKNLKMIEQYELLFFVGDEGWSMFSNIFLIDINGDSVLDLISYTKEREPDGNENEIGFSVYFWHKNKFLIFYNDVAEEIKQGKTNN